MKKTFAAFITLVLIFACCVTAAAAVPSYTAIYNAPTIDGVVNSDEYGTAAPLNKSNASLFYYNSWDIDPTGNACNPPELTYAFAWKEDALYVGITAKNIEDISDGKFQIDLSPEKKIKDSKAGVFYTFKAVALGTDGIVSVARDNFQTAGNTGKTSMNINSKCEAVATEVSSGVYNIEVKIPLAELQVSGKGGNFNNIKLKEGTWGVGCYFIGNGGGFSNTVYPIEHTDGLIQYYNDLKLVKKDTSAPSSSEPQESATSSKQQEATSSKQNAPTGNSSTISTNKPADNTSSVGTAPDTSSAIADNTASDNTASDTNSTVSDDTVSDTETNADGDSTTDNATTDNTTPAKDNTVLIVVIIAAAVIVLAAAGAAIFIVKKNKKN